MIGMAIAQGLEEQRQVGATHMGTGFDAWYPGYIDYTPIFKNIAVVLDRDGALRSTRRRATTRSTISRRTCAICGRRRSTRARGRAGWWRLRDAVEYMETASLSVLDYAAKYKEDAAAQPLSAPAASRSTQGANEAPYAYVVPQEQRDPVAAVELLRRLAFGGVRVSQLTSAVTIEGDDLSRGHLGDPDRQEFAAIAREVLDVQQYPDLRESPDGPLEQPYDAAGWTLPLQMGVSVSPLMTPITPELRGKLDPLGPTCRRPGAVRL